MRISKILILSVIGGIFVALSMAQGERGTGAGSEAGKEAAAARGAGGRSGRGGGGGARGGSTKQAVEVYPVQRRDLQETVTVVGSVAANESATIRPEVSGIVREINFAEGQQVARGQVLLRIDDSELRAQASQAESNFRQAEQSYQRIAALARSSAVSQAELDKASNDVASARANLELLQVRLGRTEVKAPFDGVVNGRSVSPGDYVTAQTAITTIDDLSRLKVDFQVPERYLLKVQSGNPFVARATSGTSRLQAEGEVYFVSSSIDRNTRSIQVKGVLTGMDGEFRPGMFANIELVLEVREGVLTVPEGAILASASGTQVVSVVERDGESLAQFVDVTLGLRVRGLVEIRPVQAGSLVAGQPVVAAGVGSLQLFNGGRLDPRPMNPDFQVGY